MERKKDDILVYLLGPLTPTGRFGMSPVFEYLRNLWQFISTEAVLTDQGIAVINPASDVLAVLVCPSCLSESQVKYSSIVKLRHCDCVMALPGWENSKGSLVEIEQAKSLGLPIFYSVEEVIKFSRERI